MKPRRWTPLLVVLLTAGTMYVSAQSFMTKTGHAEFTSSVPLHTFTGESDHLVGLINLADMTVDFYLDLETLETGIGKRDKDMRITLETEQYPFAEFFGKLTSSFDPRITDEQAATVRGNFKIHGVSQEVVLEGTLQRTKEGLKVTAAWEINLKDYDITPPRLLIVKVDEIQKVRIEALLTLVDP